MVDVAVSAQLQQWTFEKPTLVRPERSDSSVSSPDLYHNDSETLRIAAAAVDDSQDQDAKETLSFQERYLSSEEDLSPMEGNSDSDDNDDDVSIHQVQKEYFHARKMSISKFDKGKSCDLAVIVSFTSAGRPKMIDLANLASPFREPTRQRSQRSASLAQLPIATINKLREVEQASRLSLAVTPVNLSPSTSRSTSPATSVQSRPPSASPVAFSRKNSSLHSSDSSFTDSSTRSSSPWAREKTTRSFTDNSAPKSSPWANTRRPASSAVAQPARSSLYVTSAAPANTLVKPFPPLTPLSPEPHAFLSSDPYETSTVSSASPILKSSPHKRLRSISQKLSLAKIAISPSTRKWDSRVNGKSVNSPAMPLTPYTPLTPQTAPPTSFSTTNRLRRNSRITSRPTSRVGPPPEMPPMPSSMLDPQPRTLMQRMIPRGANEREPMLELPPFPAEDGNGDPAMSLKARRIRKRRSLMDLL
ncbi:hypothetical protein K505DRAFT_368633 [Melanomma pulvis-pyrius CBS 109.77]|uniref:Uncharacterized protein n=1 Tax=Melanomma pulvis-pyrius CBS 109.77 TaxID=1314802 RepID=A0A6A6WPD8_9PLEO|nr:hypothetical protein K505DRAFT_368633 [Melanomma pulvis-pyrius CBS 109.77]